MATAIIVEVTVTAGHILQFTKASGVSVEEVVATFISIVVTYTSVVIREVTEASGVSVEVIVTTVFRV